MLDAFIIEELKRREREEAERQRPVLELPIDQRLPSNDDECNIDSEGDKPSRGIIIIETLS